MVVVSVEVFGESRLAYLSFCLKDSWRDTKSRRVVKNIEFVSHTVDTVGADKRNVDRRADERKKSPFADFAPRKEAVAHERVST
jgi:hypothetical protein